MISTKLMKKEYGQRTEKGGRVRGEEGGREKERGE
jgi:hypothetical protein